MLSFAELLKAIDKFYVLAQKPFSMVKRAAEDDVYEKVDEDVYDKLINGEFADLFDEYKDAYKNFTNSLNVSTKEFGRILVGGETEDDNFADLLVPFQEAYRALIISPYLQQGIQDPNWEEGLNPQEIRAGIEALAKEANNKMYKLGKAAGITESQVRNFLESREDAFQNELEGKGDAGTNEGLSDKEIEYRNRKIEKSKEAGQTHRKRRKEGLSVGSEELTKQQSTLQDQIAKETNTIKREELGRRLNNLSSLLNTVNSYKARQKAEYERIMADPMARAKYVQENTKRKQNSRGFTKKFHEIIDRLNVATSPNDQARIKMELVRQKKELLQRNNPSIDFDADEVRYNPAIQAELNPDKIIAEYESRRQKEEKSNKKQVENIKSKFLYEGNKRIKALSWEGLHFQFKKSIPNIKMGIKKAVTAKLRLMENSEYKVFKEGIVAATAAGNALEVERISKEWQKKLNADAEKDSKVINFITYSDAFHKYLKELEEMKTQENAGNQQPIEAIENLIAMGEILLQKEIEREREREISNKIPSKLKDALVTIITELKERLGN